ncbi:MAG: substrate-binding domain-containing protein [Candidatus Binatia bacterium]
MDTKQVARYLGINEKKIYAMAKAGGIPCTRVTGKWVFPKKLIDQWIEESAASVVQGKGREEQRTFLLVAGSDDPSLGTLRDLYAFRTAAGSLFMAPGGSTAGLTAMREGLADVAMTHLLDRETGEYNLPFVKRMLPSEVVIASLFYRELGLMVGRGNPKGLERISDLARGGVRIINRQKGSGTRHYFDLELARLSMAGDEIIGYGDAVATHLEVGLKVMRDEVDAGIATKAVAQMLGLDFVPLTRERFDVLIPKERFFTQGIQVLLDIIGSREFREQVAQMGGYDVSESGRIIAG